MNTLSLRPHPKSMREVTGIGNEYPIDQKIFSALLGNLSQLKMSGELSSSDTAAFKDDLLRNDSSTVASFIEKSIEGSNLHPFIYILLLEVLRMFLKTGRMTNENYSVIFVKFLKKHCESVANRYDLKQVIKNLLDI